ncbi:MAG: deaminase [Candidatus Dojkabacteria bacterium]|nr:deaminase [Candidatus Dojkabacteria bacterium]
MKKDWINYFFSLAETVATKSKDPSKKIGCVVVGPDNEIRSTGYNGFPRKVIEFEERYHTREEKLKWTEHAERNAIYNAARIGSSLNNCSIFIHGLFPCIECSKAIIQSGIKKIYFRIPKETLIEDFRRKEFENYSKTMFTEAEIDVFEFKEES